MDAIRVFFPSFYFFVCVVVHSIGLLEYMQQLDEQEKSIQAEIMELESEKLKIPSYDFEQELLVLLRPKKKRARQLFDFLGSRNSSIEV